MSVCLSVCLSVYGVYRLPVTCLHSHNTFKQLRVCSNSPHHLWLLNIVLQSLLHLLELVMFFLGGKGEGNWQDLVSMIYLIHFEYFSFSFIQEYEIKSNMQSESSIFIVIFFSFSLSIYLSIYLFFYLSIYLSIYH